MTSMWGKRGEGVLLVTVVGAAPLFLSAGFLLLHVSY